VTYQLDRDWRVIRDHPTPCRTNPTGWTIAIYRWVDVPVELAARMCTGLGCNAADAVDALFIAVMRVADRAIETQNVYGTGAERPNHVVVACVDDAPAPRSRRVWLATGILVAKIWPGLFE
jgi:hypothetical protein